ncbi:MAG: acyl-CoA synthetase [Alphaproteobacteria bacterium]|nr:MAG: acyl-CoA synthetase [Alphaproteobacteria bacterium]
MLRLPDPAMAAGGAGLQLAVPERFNFARDVIDARSGPALLHVPAFGPPRPVSHGELSERSSRLANALLDLGLRPGAHVLVMMGREPDWFVVMLACMKAGLVAMPGTKLLTAEDVAYRINAAGAEAAIVDHRHCGKIEAITDEIPGLAYRIVTGEPVPGWIGLNRLCSHERSTPPAVETRADDTMMVYFTSGTTSRPKMVPRSHGYALAHLITAQYWMGLEAGDLHWTLTDTGWAKAAWGMLFGPLLTGAQVVVHEPTGRFDAARHLQMLQDLGVTSFCAPPTVYRLFAQEDLAAYDLSRVRRALGSGEPLNPEAMRVWREATGIEIADGYGQTESICLIGNVKGMPIRPGSMGRPMPGLDVDVIDEQGNRLAPDTPGHIAVRLTDPWPPGLFTGYLTPDGPDRRAFRNGWYYTGDTARRDADGYFWFQGRSDDLILSAGYRISPFEVESTLLEHPAVAESAVVGVRDATRGQIVRAYVVPAAGHRPDDTLAEALRIFCKARTAPYLSPREIVFVEALPKTVSGKIRRVELRGG